MSAGTAGNLEAEYARILETEGPEALNARAGADLAAELAHYRAAIYRPIIAQIDADAAARTAAYLAARAGTPARTAGRKAASTGAPLLWV